MKSENDLMIKRVRSDQFCDLLHHSLADALEQSERRSEEWRAATHELMKEVTESRAEAARYREALEKIVTPTEKTMVDAVFSMRKLAREALTPPDPEKRITGDDR